MSDSMHSRVHHQPLRRPSQPARLPFRGVVVLAGVFVLTLLGPAASAHDALVSTDPPDGTQVDVVPGQIELVFNNVPLRVGAEVQVTGPDGDVVSAEGAQVIDTSVVQAVAPDLPAGAYRVLWRVTSADGHPLSGEFNFTATTGPVAVVEPAPEPSPTPSSTAGAEPPAPTPTATRATAEDDTQEVTADQTDASSGGARLGIALAVAAAAVVAAVAAVRLFRPSSN